MNAGLLGGVSLGALPSLTKPSYLQAARGPSFAEAAAERRSAFKAVHAEVVQARRTLEGLQKVLAKPLAKAAPATPVAVTSSATLGLNHVPTSSRLTSAEEVNATPTSFTPFGPSWLGSSTSLATIGGVYDGSEGDDTFMFQVRRGGSPGTSSYRIRVFNSSGDLLDNKWVSASTPADTEFTLSTGLTMSFSAGNLKKWDKLYLNVSSSTGASVNTGLPFDGVRNANPNLDVGESVTAGSFDVNGTNVAVNADDSVDDVIARINATVADVTATFDGASESVVLTHDQTGSAHDIVLANDTSGFVSAMKLDSATVVPGLDDQRAVALDQVAAFAGVSSGTLQINGVDIAVDVTTDSLNDVLGRINAANADATSSYDDATSTVTLTSDTAGATLSLDDGGTGFFAAIGIDAIDHEPVDGGKKSLVKARRARAKQVEARLVTARRHLTRLFDKLGNDKIAETGDAGQIRDFVETGFRLAFGAGADSDEDTFRATFGLSADLRPDADQVMSFSASGQNVFRKAFVQSPDKVLAFLEGAKGAAAQGDDASPGLVNALLDALNQADQKLRDRYGAVGVLLHQIA